MKIREDLYDYCRWNEEKKVITLLRTCHEKIDVLEDDGLFFNFAISLASVGMLKALLDFFENKQFPVKDTEYEEAKEKLKEILENATDSIELSPEMKQVLSPYLNFEDELDSRLEEDFTEVDNTNYQSWINSLQSGSDNPENITCSGETEPSPDLN